LLDRKEQRRSGGGEAKAEMNGGENQGAFQNHLITRPTIFFARSFFPVDHQQTMRQDRIQCEM